MILRTEATVLHPLLKYHRIGLVVYQTWHICSGFCLNTRGIRAPLGMTCPEHFLRVFCDS